MTTLSVQDLNRKQITILAHALGIKRKELTTRGLPEPTNKAERHRLRTALERTQGRVYR